MANLKNFGKHYIVEFLDCDPLCIGYVDSVRPILVDAVVKCGATALNYAYHQFEPRGVSATVLLAESSSPLLHALKSSEAASNTLRVLVVFDAMVFVFLVGKVGGNHHDPRDRLTS